MLQKVMKRYHLNGWYCPLLIVVLCAINPVLFLIAHNRYRFNCTVAIPSAITSCAIAVIAWLVLLIFMRQPVRAGLLIAVNTTLFYFYGIFTITIMKMHFFADLGYNKLYAALIIIINTVLVYTTHKYRNLAQAISLILLIIIGISITISLVTLVFKSGKRPYSIEVQRSVDSRLGMLLEMFEARDSTPSMPDIYHIILDAYPRADILKNRFSGDNSQFISFLQSAGFSISPYGWSNYSCTDLSLPATLNFEYIQRICNKPDSTPSILAELRYLKTHSLAARFLKKLGYSTYITRNGFETDEPRTADHFIEPHASLFGLSWNEFNFGVLRMTPLPVLIDRFAGPTLTFFGQHRRQIRSALDFLSYAHRENGPKYVFAHIIAPHIPIVYGRHGEPLREEKPYLNNPAADPQKYIKAFRDEIFFLDSIVALTIRQMISADSSCVIILQSDHGELPVWPPELCPIKRVIEMRHGILFAVRAPEYPLALDDSATAVNTYPLLFNALFSCEIPLRKNRVFYSKLSSPFSFCEVTDSLGL